MIYGTKGKQERRPMLRVNVSRRMNQNGPAASSLLPIRLYFTYYF